MRTIILAFLTTSLLLHAEEPKSSSEKNDKLDKSGLKGKLGSLLKKIDKDGDGKLDDAEKEALHGKVKKEVLERYDANKDGVLSDEEKAKAKADGQKKLASGEDDSPAEKKLRAEFNKRFDKDGDGKLNEAEKKTALAAAKKLREKAPSKEELTKEAADVKAPDAKAADPKPDKS
jgi:Ca2+-binding EF-hand superfamily protein